MGLTQENNEKPNDGLKKVLDIEREEEEEKFNQSFNKKINIVQPNTKVVIMNSKIYE